MVCDAHVHMGYFLRAGYSEPFYYSPRRIVGVLNRCGVDEFIISSTCAQVPEIGMEDIVREAREMKRIAGRRAHIFFWLSWHLYEQDADMKWFETGLFDGIKLHEGETPWMKKRRDALRKVLSVAEAKGCPVMFHAGPDDGNRPRELAAVADEYPSVHFNFAHCRPMDEMAKVIADCPNVWTDISYMPLDDFPKLRGYDWHGRLMFGTDVPVWQACEDISLKKRYREYVQATMALGIRSVPETAFRDFVGI